MKLNGWKRIGIVASVVWIIGAYIYTFRMEVDETVRISNSLDQDCLSSGTDFPGETVAQVEARLEVCEKRLDDFMAKANSSDEVYAALAAVVPVPLGWGFVFLILFLVRWIKRGFGYKSP